MAATGLTSDAAARVSEILCTYPFHESDLIVIFFTRDQHKVRGIAHQARKPKNSASLERPSLVTLNKLAKENRAADTHLIHLPHRSGNNRYSKLSELNTRWTPFKTQSSS